MSNTSNTIQMPPEIAEIMIEVFGSGFSARNPRTNKPIEFTSGPHKRDYLRFVKDGNEYCYTPHPDKDNWYYSFAYIGVGHGSRTGKPTRWKLKFLRCHRLRKDAKARAIKMYRKAG